MTIDGITLALVIKELQFLAQAKIEKIYQPNKDEITLLLHTIKGRKRLLFSASAADSRMHIIETGRENPQKAPNFCMLLRKHLLNGRIISLAQEGLDRIVKIEIASYDEMGVLQQFTLVIEMMGKYSNIILLNSENRVLDAIKRVSMDTSRVRQIFPGIAYEIERNEKANPLTTDEPTLRAALTDVTEPRALVRKIQGLSPAAAEEIFYRAYGENTPAVFTDTENAQLFSATKHFFETCFTAPMPTFETNAAGLPVFFSPIPFTLHPDRKRYPYESANEMLDAFYTARDRHLLLERKRERLQKVLTKQLGRVEKTLKIQLETLQGGEDADQYLLYGELVSANIYQLQRGMKEAVLLNYYTNEEITVPLDETLSPAANATKFFKRASKMKNGALLAKTRVENLQEEHSFLEALQFDLKNATTFDGLEEIEGELIRYKYITPEKQAKRKRSDPLSHPRQFLTSNGLKILAGRNNRQNDVLTMRVAGAEDIWFHTKGIPGSHVILFTGQKQADEQDLLEAATIAATLSAAKGGKVSVDHTLRKHIWKANGAKPGMVLFENQKTLMAEPDPVLLRKLEVLEETHQEER